MCYFAYAQLPSIKKRFELGCLWRNSINVKGKNAEYKAEIFDSQKGCFEIVKTGYSTTITPWLVIENVCFQTNLRLSLQSKGHLAENKYKTF